MTSFLKLSVQFITNIFPNRKTVWLNDHRSAYLSVINKLCLFDNVCIPLSKIVFHCRNFFNKLFLFTHAIHLLYMVYFEIVFPYLNTKNPPSKKGTEVWWYHPCLQ